eukprot:TRINITY_DN4319_c0_g2_i3.p1 TRINITY_DN4319_c0_g2~~TRINITY_DN4319_c0_g2_i3.p1  ORF type:complete len:188 (+),score=50.10 TRINITY_DN4319_c0_g2_i3:283-846(+)
MSTTSSKKQKQRKIAVLGFRGVGKSSVTIQFVENHFVDGYNPTIENSFHKTIKRKGSEFDTEILDTAGLDEYSHFLEKYSVGIHGYVLVYSVTSKSSFEVVKTIREKLLDLTGNDVHLVLVGNKTDLHYERKVTEEEGKALAEEWGCPFVESSAKHNDGIEEAFSILMESIEGESNPKNEDEGCLIL